MAGKSRELTPEELAERQALYDDTLQEEAVKPLKWVSHDTDAHNDDGLRRLRMRHGWEAIGRWWHLVELLAARRGHCYDVSTDEGWEMLAEDMLCDADGARELVGWLSELGLIESEMLEGEGVVRSERIERVAWKAAESVASGKVGAWNRKHGV